MRPINTAGRWLVAKARRQLREVGPYQAARNLRKQGVPFGLAVRILLGKRPRI
jgi:hypothetical protein